MKLTDDKALVSKISNHLYAEFLAPNLVDHPMETLDIPRNMARADKVTNDVLQKVQITADAATEKAIRYERERWRLLIGHLSDSEDWDMLSESWRNRLTNKSLKESA